MLLQIYRYGLKGKHRPVSAREEKKKAVRGKRKLLEEITPKRKFPLNKVAQELALSRTFGDEQGRVEISEEARIKKIDSTTMEDDLGTMQSS